MAVTVAAKNYTVLSTCESSTDGGVWLALTTQDIGDKKQGTYSLCGIIRASGVSVVTFTPTTSKDLSGTKHVRWWMILAQGGLLETYALDGLNFWASDGANTGYWKILGRDTYEGGWINCVIDVSKACDSGTKPTAMNAITSMGFRITLVSAAKNAVNTWVDHLCICDGLVAYGDDAGGYFDIDDIYTADNATTGGWGIVRKIGGQYFSTGLLEIGYATSATKFQAKSQVLVFENRRVSDTLYKISTTDPGGTTYTTEFILGSKAGTAGIEGCIIRGESATQTPKFYLDGRTDTDTDNFKLYGTTFFDAAAISIPNQSSGMSSVHRARASNVVTLGVNSHGLVVNNTILVQGLSGLGYNGTWTVASVVDANHFTYACSGGDEGETADTGGTITSMNIEVLNCNFESCDEVAATTAIIVGCNFVAANDEGFIFPSGDTHQITDCAFVGCPDAVRVPSSGSYNIYGLKFINNTNDIDNTSGGTVTLNCFDGSNPITYTGATDLINSKELLVTCLDTASEPVAGVIVTVHASADMSELMQDTTDAFGVAHGSINYTADVPALVWARKSSPGDTRYINESSRQTIDENGLSITITMRVDPTL